MSRHIFSKTLAMLAIATLAMAATPRPSRAAFYKNLSRLPASCQAVPDADLLHCYLTVNWQIAMQISWLFPGRSIPTVEYRNWPAAMQSELNTEFTLAMYWYKQALPHLRARRILQPGAPVQLPPPGPPPAPLQRFTDPIPKEFMQAPLQEGVRVTSTVARRIYLSWIANSLAAEITRAHPWSLRDYDGPELQAVFSYFNIVYMAQGSPRLHVGPGWQTRTHVSPANATYVVDFARRYGILEYSARDTAARLIEWGNRLEHTFRSQNLERLDPREFWGPDALPAPQRLMLEGSYYTGADPGRDGLRHWTEGCSGTTSFFIATLRALNLPVQRLEAPCVPHDAPHFMSIGYAMLHADNMHNRLVRNDPLIPGEELMVTIDEYHELLPGPEAGPDYCDIVKANMSRLPREIAVEYLTDGLLDLYCGDELNEKTHAEGDVYESLEKTYSLEELEAMQLWDNLEAKAVSKGMNCW